MEKSSFFNSVNHDRRYKAEDWAEYFASFIGNGVFAAPSSNLQITADSGMTIAVQPGKAWINGYIYINTDKLYIKLDNADGALKRIARVVLRWDLLGRRIYAAVKYSSFSANPTAPALQRTADIYEMCLGDVMINNGVTSISQSAITDRRFDSALCGVVTGVVNQIDPTNLFAQYNSAYWEWFDGVREHLTSDVAGNLQAQINGLSIEQNYLHTTTVRYVSATGNDANDGLTASTAFKTPDKAFASVPSAAPLTINVLGAFGALNIRDRSGSVTIQNPGGAANFTTCTIENCNNVSVDVYSNGGGRLDFYDHVTCKDSRVEFRASSTNGIYISKAMTIERCEAVLWYVSTRLTDTSVNGIDISYSNARVYNCAISGRNIAVRAAISTVNCHALTGSGNVTAAQSTYAGLLILTAAATGIGTTMYSKANGGVIFAAGIQQ